MNQRDIANLGQVFTPPAIVELMLGLRANHGRILEPSAGAGAFSERLPGCVAIEFDPRVARAHMRVEDFFAYPASERFDTVIGNPPYVRFQDIPPATRARLDMTHFDGRSNLFLFFIEKAIRHLDVGGELIFIVPREFIKLTAARKLNRWLFECGTITHWIETGDTRIFDGAVPNCAIFRFERGNFSRRTLLRTLDEAAWSTREFVEMDGQLAFAPEPMSVPLASLFTVKVGAVSGADRLFEHPEGNVDFVHSKTIDSGHTRRMLYNLRHPALDPHKTTLLARRIKPFDESNWWTWGRHYPATDAPRIYVNARTRRDAPFFLHPATAFDGAILALFARDPAMDLAHAVSLLNTAVPWEALGFRVDGRYLFTQRSLQTLMLPASFSALATAA
ncbi:class I SAM-dependent methyltransferase [Nitrogeniibacter mangrovi]|uniref:site-specific DNA-methyltransferase (adenine-specific) n=1 Tax=Nitrogeniibacter mangrovi TaxID=2016596 RepID=A0A6C1B3W7_9RHOO|nr:class I SAM-dependent methyltransferase [Nitrogeniibacter mangrovi]QID17689.1 class I SAM-dependent methyltransferase [Nitrogeniibacter mangrovi]